MAVRMHDACHHDIPIWTLVVMVPGYRYLYRYRYDNYSAFAFSDDQFKPPLHDLHAGGDRRVTIGPGGQAGLMPEVFGNGGGGTPST